MGLLMFVMSGLDIVFGEAAASAANRADAEHVRMLHKSQGV